jgi:hypothetical protein
VCVCATSGSLPARAVWHEPAHACLATCLVVVVVDEQLIRGAEAREVHQEHRQVGHGGSDTCRLRACRWCGRVPARSRYSVRVCSGQQVCCSLSCHTGARHQACMRGRTSNQQRPCRRPQPPTALTDGCSNRARCLPLAAAARRGLHAAPQHAQAGRLSWPVQRRSPAAQRQCQAGGPGVEGVSGAVSGSAHTQRRPRPIKSVVDAACAASTALNER